MRAIFEERGECWILSIVTSGGECSLLRKLAPIRLCCWSLGLFLPGLKTYSEDNTQHLPACARGKAKFRVAAAALTYNTRPALDSPMRAHSTRVRFAQGLPDFPPELSSFHSSVPFHCFLLLLIRPSLPSVRRRFRILWARARCFTVSLGSR